MRAVITIGWGSSWAGIGATSEYNMGLNSKRYFLSCVEVKVGSCTPSNMSAMSSDIPDQKELMKRVRNF